MRWPALMLGLLLTACGAGIRYTTSWQTALYRCERGGYTTVDVVPHAVELKTADGAVDVIPLPPTREAQRRRQALTQAVQRARARGFVVVYNGDPGAALRDALPSSGGDPSATPASEP